MNEVLLYNFPDGGEQTGHVFAVCPSAAPRIENGLQLLHNEGKSPPRRKIALIMRVSATVQA